MTDWPALGNRDPWPFERDFPLSLFSFSGFVAVQKLCIRDWALGIQTVESCGISGAFWGWGFNVLATGWGILQPIERGTVILLHSELLPADALPSLLPFPVSVASVSIPLFPLPLMLARSIVDSATEAILIQADLYRT